MKLFQLLASFVLTATLSATAAAQCLTPDGLDPSTAGCSPAFTQVPQRGFQQQALGLCFRDCALESQANYTAQWGALNPVGPNIPGALPSCAWYVARLRIFIGSALQWDGQMHFTYARTWAEAGTSGAPIQVWRYLVNGDLRPTGNTALPCGVPACAAPNGMVVRFTGYVDYARDCGTTLTERAWMISHACDTIDHTAGFPRAGSFHPGRSFAFVGPALGFVPGAPSVLEGGAIGPDAMRKWDVPVLPARCFAEEPVLGGVINPLPSVCLCGVGPANWHEATMFVGGAFGSTLSPFPGSDPFRSFPIGSWTIPTMYPGVEDVRWNCNEGSWTDCTGVTRPEFFFGVTTHGGYPAFTVDATGVSVPLPSVFIDQSNSMVLPLGVSTRNRPYRSDRILNLNL